MKDILKNIQNKLAELQGLNYIDENWGQLSYYDTFAPVKLPCALIGIDQAQYSNIGVNYQVSPINRQIAEATLSVTIADIKLSNTGQKAPESQKNNAWKVYELLEEVHQKLQGFKPAEKGTALIRQRVTRIKRADGIQEFTLVYNFSLHDC